MQSLFVKEISFVINMNVMSTVIPTISLCEMKCNCLYSIRPNGTFSRIANAVSTTNSVSSFDYNNPRKREGRNGECSYSIIDIVLDRQINKQYIIPCWKWWRKKGSSNHTAEDEEEEKVESQRLTPLQWNIQHPCQLYPHGSIPMVVTPTTTTTMIVLAFLRMK